MVCYGCKQSLPFKTLIPASVALSKEVYYPFLRPLFRALTSQKRHFLPTMEDTAVGSFFLMENSPMVYFQLLPLSPCTTLGWSLISARVFSFPKHLLGCRCELPTADSPAEGTSLRQWILLHTQEGFHLDLSSPGPV